MNNIIKIANEITNISNSNATNFTSSQKLQKTEQQIKDEVVEMIYQQHLQAQEWGNKLNNKSEQENELILKNKKIRNKREIDWKRVAVLTAGGAAFGATFGAAGGTSVGTGPGTSLGATIGGVGTGTFVFFKTLWEEDNKEKSRRKREFTINEFEAF